MFYIYRSGRCVFQNNAYLIIIAKYTPVDQPSMLTFQESRYTVFVRCSDRKSRLVNYDMVPIQILAPRSMNLPTALICMFRLMPF